MNQIVEILLILGILINLIKGADLLLRPHQQKWLQDKCDDLALRLSYTKPIDWYKRHPGLYRLFISIGFSLVCLFISFFMFLESFSFDEGLSPIFLLIISFWIIASYTSKILDTEYAAPLPLNPSSGLEKIRELEHKLLRWVISGQTYLQGYLRPLFSLILSSMVISAFFAIPWFVGLITKQSVDSRNIVVILILMIGIFVYLLAFFFLVSRLLLINLILGLAFTFTLVILVLELILLILRAIVWRIAEYNKGAFAAIVLIITIALGVTEFYLKTKNPNPPPPTPLTAPAQPSSP